MGNNLSLSKDPAAVLRQEFRIQVGDNIRKNITNNNEWQSIKDELSNELIKTNKEVTDDNIVEALGNMYLDMSSEDEIFDLYHEFLQTYKTALETLKTWQEEFIPDFTKSWESKINVVPFEDEKTAKKYQNYLKENASLTDEEVPEIVDVKDNTMEIAATVIDVEPPVLKKVQEANSTLANKDKPEIVDVQDNTMEIAATVIDVEPPVLKKAQEANSTLANKDKPEIVDVQDSTMEIAATVIDVEPPVLKKAQEETSSSGQSWFKRQINGVNRQLEHAGNVVGNAGKWIFDRLKSTGQQSTSAEKPIATANNATSDRKNKMKRKNTFHKGGQRMISWNRKKD